MPVTIMMMGIVFNVLNGMMQAGGLFYFASEGMYSGGWTYLLKTHAWSGLLLLFCRYAYQSSFRPCDSPFA